MELISEYLSWCEGGRKSSIDPKDRASSNASEEEEKEVAVEIKANGKNERPLYQRKKKKKNEQPLELRQMGRMKDPCIRRRRKKKKKRPLELRQMGIYGEFFDILLVVEW